ncbi:hypothetical protein [Aliikangiella sp. G2MR2-5]|uniref:hypothetical protein n=1 Tax=Aliikangiella sp. G2MR2-5 TaxID=2788943 RepID=UPI0018A969D8|nr:hypothetical protein [Aliikangiella sp. G2MR2-5]
MLHKFVVPIALSMLFLLPQKALSHDRHDDLAKGEVGLFYSYESNGEDYIYGIGTGLTLFSDSSSGFAGQLLTTFNQAEVTATDGYIEDYFAWEGIVRLGFFSNISVYGEVGIDLTEALFHDFRYDDDDYYDHHHHNDDIDAFAGVGAGIRLGKFQLTAFSRLREIDSRYWEAEKEHFTGLQFSVNF